MVQGPSAKVKTYQYLAGEGVPAQWMYTTIIVNDSIPGPFLFQFRAARKNVSQSIRKAGYTPDPGTIQIEKFVRIGYQAYGIAMKSKELVPYAKRIINEGR